MKTGIIDRNGIEICTGDKVRKINRLDSSTIWEVSFGNIDVNIDNTIKTIRTFILECEESYEEVMETEIHWRYAENDKTIYEIVK